MKMAVSDLKEKVISLIAEDKLKEAIQVLRKVLHQSPLLEEAVIQSARYTDTMRQIRMGTILSDQAEVSKSRIRKAVLDLLDEMEELAGNQTEIREELSRQEITHIILSNNTLNSGGDIIIGGNKNIQ